ncbi:hypothetical protein LSAT2_018275 [Lamellibrachia satsuma]|nr:hypothetical protein LSAT2_018275 [Lamellibrachia satsuma]
MSKGARGVLFEAPQAYTRCGAADVANTKDMQQSKEPRKDEEKAASEKGPSSPTSVASRMETPTRKPSVMNLMGRASLASIGISMRFTRSLREAAAKVKEKEKVPVENTYRLAPDNSDIFNPCKVSNALEVLLSAFLASKSYSPVQSPRLVCDLTARILARAKKFSYRRYKLVAHAIVGQPSDVDLQVASRCLWVAGIDDFATATFSNGRIYAVVAVYAIYFE